MSLDQVPDEIIQHLLYYVSAEDNLTRFQPLSRRLSTLANECLLWKHHCCTYFSFWDASHDFPQKLRLPVAAVDWKRLFLLRSHRNLLISTLFDGILETKLGRLRRIETICRLGYDAKDFLISQCQLHESAEDVLTRRCVAEALLPIYLHL